jgi:septum site-determining protein MinC
MSQATADRSDASDDDVPCAPLFATETMAELSARQGRLADAASIYRHLLRGAASDPAAADRVQRWQARLAELDSGATEGPAQPASAQAAPARPAPRAPDMPAMPAVAVLAAPRARHTLVIREPVRSGQVIYADGRDLIVLAPVNPGAQLMADGHIHVYGALKGRAVAGARGLRDAQVFCLTLEAELVGVDTGYVVSEDIPAAVRGGPARIFLTPDGTCAIAALPVGGRSPAPTPARGWR